MILNIGILMILIFWLVVFILAASSSFKNKDYGFSVFLYFLSSGLFIVVCYFIQRLLA